MIGTITSKQLSDTIYFSANSLLITDLEYNKKTIFLYDTSIVSSKINTFYYEILNILKINGVSSYSENELLELEQIILSSTGGPKGTIMQGQTKFNEVIDVDIKYQKE